MDYGGMWMVGDGLWGVWIVGDGLWGDVDGG